MAHGSWNPSRLIPLAMLAVGCASVAEEQRERLPFHVAMLPVALEVAPLAAPIEEGSETELTLSFANGHPADELHTALEQSFSKVTRLSAQPAKNAGDSDQQAWIREARASGADLIFEPTLYFQKTVRTSLNDRFWLNLPLFALGGPTCWFVNDRSYHFDVRLRGGFIDVSAASDETYPDADWQVLVFDRRLPEVSLDFLDRADGAGSYALGVIVPAGFISKESAEVVVELEQSISEELSSMLVRSLAARENEIVYSGLVDFYPQEVAVIAGETGCCLEGEFILELGNVSELDVLRYRFSTADPFREAGWESVTVQRPEGRLKGLRRYGFRVPLGSDDGRDAVQLEVRQLDRFLSRRTFTYLVAGATGQGDENSGEDPSN